MYTQVVLAAGVPAVDKRAAWSVYNSDKALARSFLDWAAPFRSN